MNINNNSCYNKHNNSCSNNNHSCNNNNNISCNISCNNNNNNNNNSSFSDLFYKVIHNKYLFNLIFNHLHSLYDNCNQTRFRFIDDSDEKERIKFKDIVSLKLMVENKLYQLLKCKLEANEYIKVDNDRNHHSWLNDLYKQDRQLSIAILKLLLKSTSISNPDSIFGSIHLLNLELIKIATDPSSPHSIQVQQDMVKNALLNSIPKAKALLDSLYGLINRNNNISSISNNNSNNKLEYSNINNNNYNSTLFSSNQLPSTSTSSDYINQFKNTIVNLVVEINDPFERDIALEFILGNSQYYNIPPSASTSSSSDINNNNNNNNIDSDLDIQLISIQDIVYGVISVDLQNQLLDLNYYYIPESLATYKDQINNIINNSYNSHNNHLKYNRSKKLLELFRDNGLENENNHSNQLANSISSWFYDFEKLQLIVSNNQNDWRGWSIKIEQYINSINLVEDEERIKYYHALKQIQEFSHIGQYIDNRISVQLSQRYGNGKNFELYNIKLTESLRNNNDNNNNSNLDSNSSNNSNNNSSSQKSLQLDINTIIVRINKCSESSSIMDVYNSLSSLITLQYEPNSITTTSNQINFGSVDNHQQDQQSTYTFRRFSAQHIILTCWIRVFLISIKLGSNDRITLLLKLNFNPIIQHHQQFIELWNSKFLPITIKDDFPIFEKDGSGYIQFNSQIFKESGFTERNPNGMVEIIKALLDNYKQHQQAIIAIQQQHQQQLQNMEIGNQNDDDQMSERDYNRKKEREMILKLSAPDFVINYLFRMLLQSNGQITLDTIKSIYKLINDSNIIKVQQSTLFSIYYLSLKSKYFIKYIATSPYLIAAMRSLKKSINIYYLDATQGKTANENYINSSTKFDFAKFINPQVFTFEFVLLNNNNSFFNILKALVDRYMVESFKKNSIMEVNRTLLFILEVRGFDLFFNCLEQLKNHDIEFFNQNIQFTLPLFKSFVLAVNQDALYKLLKEYQPQFNELLNNKYNSYQVCKYYKEINSIIPITEIPVDNINFVLSHSDVVVKNHALLFGDNKITDYKFGRIDFNHYSTDHYKLLINQYPNHPVFKLSKIYIAQLIQSRSIIKLKQLYQNQLINDQPSDHEEYDKLLSYLKSQLKQHNINCNWLNN